MVANSDAVRWQQRLENFGKALVQLEEACAKGEYSNLERAGLVQMFEFSFELAWKTLKDLLYFQGFDVKTPREVIRKAFAAGYVEETGAEVLLDALNKRNLLSHTYDEETAEEAESLITKDYAPVLRKVFDSLESRRKS